MNDEILDTPESLTQEEVTINDEQEFELPAEDAEEPAPNKFEEIARNQKARAEKAEKEAKELKAKLAETTAQPKQDAEQLNMMEVIAFAKADIPEEDIPTVLNLAKSMGLKPTEALKNDEIRAVLKVRDEKRRSENAMNANRSQQAVPKSAQAIASKVNSGAKVSDSDIEAYLANRYKPKE